MMGVRATMDNFRLATDAEVAQWEEYKHKQKEQLVEYYDTDTHIE